MRIPAISDFAGATKEPVATVDGVDVTAENGAITLGNAVYGYSCDGKIYKPGTTVEITDGMAFTSINDLSVTIPSRVSFSAC